MEACGIKSHLFKLDESYFPSDSHPYPKNTAKCAPAKPAMTPEKITRTAGFLIGFNL